MSLLLCLKCPPPVFESTGRWTAEPSCRSPSPLDVAAVFDSALLGGSLVADPLLISAFTLDSTKVDYDFVYGSSKYWSIKRVTVGIISFTTQCTVCT